MAAGRSAQEALHDRDVSLQLQQVWVPGFGHEQTLWFQDTLLETHHVSAADSHIS